MAVDVAISGTPSGDALTECASVQTPADPHTLLERLSAEVSRHVSHEPHDDIGLLVVRRQPP